MFHRKKRSVFLAKIQVKRSPDVTAIVTGTMRQLGIVALGANREINGLKSMVAATRTRATFGHFFYR